MDEHSLGMLGIIDESTIAELGKIKAADFLITGNISERNRIKIIEAQIIKLVDGEVVVSKSISIK